MNIKLVLSLFVSFCFIINSCNETSKEKYDNKYQKSNWYNERETQDNRFYEHKLITNEELLLSKTEYNGLRLIISYPSKRETHIVNLKEYYDKFITSNKVIDETRKPYFRSTGQTYRKEIIEDRWEEVMQFIDKQDFFTMPISDLYTEETMVMSDDNRWILEVKCDDKYNRISRNLDFDNDDIKFYKKILDIFPDSLVSSFPLE